MMHGAVSKDERSQQSVPIVTLRALIDNYLNRDYFGAHTIILDSIIHVMLSTCMGCYEAFSEMRRLVSSIKPSILVSMSDLPMCLFDYS
jgi:hypothetical protein